MAKYCPMCDTYTNCTDNCKSCMEEEKKSEVSPMQFVGEMAINMCRYISKNEEETKCQNTQTLNPNTKPR